MAQVGHHPFQPIGRIGRPEEIAALVVYLASDASKDVSNQIFSVRKNEIVLYNKRTKPAPEAAVVKTGTESPFLVNDAVFIKADNAFERVQYDDIFFIEANGNMVTIFTKNRDYHIRKSMKEIEEILPSNDFLRVQKSYIVHLGQIESFNTKEITLKKVRWSKLEDSITIAS